MSERVCVYCGVYGDSVDHFIPWSYNGTGRRKGRDFRKDQKNLVYACRECNCIAGNKVFERLDDKREYIQNRLRIKYKRIINLPYWSPSEIKELDYTLRAGLEIKLLSRKWVMNRINYPYVVFDIDPSEETLQNIMLIFTK